MEHPATQDGFLHNPSAYEVLRVESFSRITAHCVYVDKEPHRSKHSTVGEKWVLRPHGILNIHTFLFISHFLSLLSLSFSSSLTISHSVFSLSHIPFSVSPLDASIYLSICPSVYLSIYLPIYLSINQSMYQRIHQSIHQSNLFYSNVVIYVYLFIHIFFVPLCPTLLVCVCQFLRFSSFALLSQSTSRYRYGVT